MTAGSFFAGLSLYLILGALLLSFAGRNKRWMIAQPMPFAAAALATWPGVLALVIGARTDFGRAIDLWDDLRDWLHIFITSRFRS